MKNGRRNFTGEDKMPVPDVCDQAGIETARPPDSVLAPGQCGVPPRESDFLCIHCGYNLTGLQGSSMCPECSTAIERSVRGDQLRYADAEWLTCVSRGIRCVHAGFFTGVIACVVFFVVIGPAHAYLKPKCTPFIWDFSLPLALSAPGFLMLWGVMALTRVDPRLALTERSLTTRRFARGSAILVMTLLPFVLSIIARETRGVASHPTLMGAVKLMFGLGLVSVLVAVTSYLGCLVKRVPAQELAQRCGLVVNLIAGCTVLLALVRVVSPDMSFGRAFEQSPIMGLLKLVDFGLAFTLLASMVSMAGVWGQCRKAMRGSLAREHSIPHP